MKFRFLTALFLACLLAGCTQAPAPSEPYNPHSEVEDEPTKSLYQQNLDRGIPMEDFTENEDLAYVKWGYEGDLRTWARNSNLSGTSSEYLVPGQRILTCPEEYEALLAHINSMEKPQYEGYYGPIILVDTLGTPFDQAFFQTNNLLVADYCSIGAVYYRSRLDSVEVGDTVTVTISHEYPYTSTADCPGELYWIPIPKNCTQAEVIYLKTAWNHDES